MSSSLSGQVLAHIALPISLFAREALQVVPVNKGPPTYAHNADVPPPNQVVHLGPSDPEQDRGRLDPKQHPSFY